MKFDTLDNFIEWYNTCDGDLVEIKIRRHRYGIYVWTIKPVVRDDWLSYFTTLQDFLEGIENYTVTKDISWWKKDGNKSAVIYLKKRSNNNAN